MKTCSTIFSKVASIFHSTIFLKIGVIFIGIPVLVLCIFLVPEIASYMAKMYPEFPYIKYLVFIFFYMTAIPFYFALYQAFKLLICIDRNNAFSDLSVKALENIKYSAFTISILYIAGMPLFYLFAERDDAPGVIIIGMFFIFISLVIAVFAGVLQKLFQNAIEIKTENDLTV